MPHWPQIITSASPTWTYAKYIFRVHCIQLRILIRTSKLKPYITRHFLFCQFVWETIHPRNDPVSPEMVVFLSFQPETGIINNRTDYLKICIMYKSKVKILRWKQNFPPNWFPDLCFNKSKLHMPGSMRLLNILIDQPYGARLMLTYEISQHFNISSWFGKIITKGGKYLAILKQ